MAAIHPDFTPIQLRLRRLNPAWYPADKPIDQEWGPGMSFGIDAALGELEKARGLPPYGPPPGVSAIQVGAPPYRPEGMPAGMDRKFSFLFGTPLPPIMVRVALSLYGTLETPGTADNPIILGWADEVANATASAYDDWAATFYNDDSIPWCGLFIAVCAVRSAQGRPERMPVNKYLAALSWRDWGVNVPKSEAAVGDIMVMSRSGGGHVTINVGTEKGERRFFGLGGNQSDRVNIAPFDIGRVVAVRRPPYRDLPAGARRVILSAGGVSSTNEA